MGGERYPSPIEGTRFAGRARTGRTVSARGDDMRIEELHVLIGKQIAGIISVKGRRSVPHDQLFLLLNDNTHFEIFGSALGWSGRVYPGGRD